MVGAKPTDAEALAAACHDPQAFAVVFERHFDAVFRYLRRRVGRELAEDLAAEVFAEAFRGRQRYDASRADARPWLYGIAVNLLRHHYREEERKLRAFARSGIDEVVTDDRALDRVEATSASREIAVVLASLPAAEREVLLLHAWAELDHAEIAEALAIPPATVRTRLHRARARLRERLAAKEQYVEGAERSNG